MHVFHTNSYVTVFWETDILYFGKCLFEILNVTCLSCGSIQSRQIPYKIVQLYSYHFIAKSTSYLNAAGF